MLKHHAQGGPGPLEIPGSLSVRMPPLYLAEILLSREGLGPTAPSNTLLKNISQEAFSPDVGG